MNILPLLNPIELLGVAIVSIALTVSTIVVISDLVVTLRKAK